MSVSPNSSLVQRTVDLNYANKLRSESLKWLLVNSVLLAILAYDLWGCWGGCGGGALAWAEGAGACVLVASCARRAAGLAAGAARRARLAPRALSPRQQALLGLADRDLDSSFVVTREASACETPPRRRAAGGPSEEPGSLSPPRAWGPPEEPGSLSPPRAWRRPGDSPPSPHSSGSPPSPRGAGSPSPGRASPDEFISDSRTLAAYLSRQRDASAEEGAGGGRGGGALPAPPRGHQLALMPDRNASEGGEEEGGGQGAGGGQAAGAGAGGGAGVWRRLRVDPRRLTEYNLNLRLWLHVTVVGRVARELEAAEAAGVSLAALGAGGVGGAGAGTGGARADALLPFLRPFADRQYVADRIKELARGGCLSAYRWSGGGAAAGTGGGRPADADLLLHLFATYMELVVPGGGFAARHVSRAPPAPAPGPAPAPARDPRALRLHRTPRSPPHYVLVLGEETLEVEAGRNNLLHTLLLFLAAAARAEPPALCRLHLGPAGLNMLWVLGR